MRHRVFIAINLPEGVKKNLLDFQSKWLELPARWVKPDNLHITLAFLGYLSDDELLNVCKIAKDVASRHQSFSIKLNKILYGPPKKNPPRMVWVEGEKSKELAELRNDLEKELSNFGDQKFEKLGVQPFSPHITLARIKQWELRNIEPEERPNINEDISLSFEVNSIEIMESELKRAGPEYSVLESAPLKV